MTRRRLFLRVVFSAGLFATVGLAVAFGVYPWWASMFLLGMLCFALFVRETVDDVARYNEARRERALDELTRTAEKWPGGYQ